MGRPTKWGNPWPAKWFDSRQACIERYHEYLLKRPELLAALGELTGKRLACSCAPLWCHADILARMANNPWVLKAYARSSS